MLQTSLHIEAPYKIICFHFTNIRHFSMMKQAPYIIPTKLYKILHTYSSPDIDIKL
jgi:hypothetical protein